MIKIKTAAFACMISLLSVAPLYASVPENTPGMIRVHLSTAQSFTIGSPGSDFTVIYGDGQKIKPSSDITVSLSGSSIAFCGKKTDDMIKITSSSHIYMNGKPYRGDIFVLKNQSGKSIWAINKLSVENYLYGVVGSEMPSSWALEALKAQSVAARTYAASRKKAPKNEAFDVFSTVMDQVYTGVSGESPSVVEAVTETAGEILTHGGEPITAFFYSSCGGRTSNNVNVFGEEDIPYLVSRDCLYCNKSSSWSYTITRKELESILKSKKIITGSLLNIKQELIDESGRSSKIRLICSDGDKIVKGADLRLMIGAGKQKSTLYRIERMKMQPADKKALMAIVKKDAAKKAASKPAASPMKDPRDFDEDMLPDEVVPDEAPKTADNDKKAEWASLDAYSAFVFSGTGWGHGVGMCQWGAGGLAKQGYDYRKILAHYYPGASLVQMDF
ncbi:MAG: SpoIID/LytB domain-containing protein [bacterium]|nr:SpoIID/LytB domain-containing protein [bacterium]